MFNLRALRFRSLERNQDNDERRIAFIQKSCVPRSQTQKPSHRSSSRMAKAQRSVIFLVEQADDGELDPKHTAEITNFEQRRTLAGEQRLAQLKSHIEFLRAIEVAATRMHH